MNFTIKIIYLGFLLVLCALLNYFKLRSLFFLSAYAKPLAMHEYLRFQEDCFSSPSSGSCLINWTDFSCTCSVWDANDVAFGACVRMGESFADRVDCKDIAQLDSI